MDAHLAHNQEYEGSSPFPAEEAGAEGVLFEELSLVEVQSMLQHME